MKTKTILVSALAILLGMASCKKEQINPVEELTKPQLSDEPSTVEYTVPEKHKYEQKVLVKDASQKHAVQFLLKSNDENEVKRMALELSDAQLVVVFDEKDLKQDQVAEEVASTGINMDALSTQKLEDALFIEYSNVNLGEGIAFKLVKKQSASRAYVPFYLSGQGSVALPMTLNTPPNHYYSFSVGNTGTTSFWSYHMVSSNGQNYSVIPSTATLLGAGNQKTYFAALNKYNMAWLVDASGTNQWIYSTIILYYPNL